MRPFAHPLYDGVLLCATVLVYLPVLVLSSSGTVAAVKLDAANGASTTEPLPRRPNLLFTIIDDLGSHDLGFQSHQLLTPHIDSLASEAVLLRNYYVLPVCSPTRTSILSGLYPMRYGLQHQVIWSGAPAGLPTNISTVADHLSAGGYACHAIGKWHAGYYTWQHTPTFRGFDSYLGYYGGGEGYYSHESGAGSEAPGPKLSSGYDFRLDDGRHCGADCSQVLRSLNGSTCSGFADSEVCVEKYSTIVFSARAGVDGTVSVISRHNSSQPLFIYLAFQAVHAPDQVPQRYKDLYNGTVHNPKRLTFGGMLTAADEGICNVSRALAERGMDSNLITVITTDNGGPNDQGPDTKCPPMSYCSGTGTSNWPLRGGKHTLWEGGVRGTALIHSKSLLPLSKSVEFTSLMHVSDWLPTLLSATMLSAPEQQYKLDGVSQWDDILSTSRGSVTKGQRHEVLIFWDPLPIAFNGEVGDAPKSAIRIGEYKLILGPPGCPSSRIPPYRANEAMELAPGRGPDDPPVGAGDCVRDFGNSTRLYNVNLDAGEEHDLSSTMPGKVTELAQRIAELVSTMPPPHYPDNDPNANPALHGGVWTPWQSPENQ